MFLKYNLFGILWAILIFFLVLTPQSKITDTPLIGPFEFDNLAHAFVYAILVILLIIGFKKQYKYSFLKYHAIGYALAWSVSYSIVLEFFQIFTTDRHFELSDINSNLCGCFLGFIAFFIIYGKKFVMKQ